MPESPAVGSAPPPLLPELFGRVSSFFGAKLLLFVVAMPLFTAGYVAAQYVSPFDPAIVPETWFDRAVPFASWWVWPYVSLYVFIPAGPVLWSRRQHMRDYIIALCITEAVCLTLFVMIPTGVPRLFLENGEPLNWAMRMIVTVDRPVNACPSLHASLVALTLIAGSVAMRTASRRLRIAIHLIAWPWAIAILLGTLGTKQHRFLDLVAGIGVAIVAYAISVRYRQWRIRNAQPTD